MLVLPDYVLDFPEMTLFWILPLYFLFPPLELGFVLHGIILLSIVMRRFSSVLGLLRWEGSLNKILNLCLIIIILPEFLIFTDFTLSSQLVPGLLSYFNLYIETCCRFPRVSLGFDCFPQTQ